VSLHPLATDAASGRAVDLHPYLDDRASLHRAMRASCSLPLVAGRPVAFAAGSYLDAGLSEAIPLDTPLAAGTTHLLVLSSRRDGELSRDSAVARRLLDAWLRRHAPGARDAFRTRGPRAATVAERLTRHNHEIDAAPSIMTIRPSRDAPQIGRMESDGAVLAGGLAAGHDAFQTALAGATRFARRYPSC
jgi:predicted patatin/cPLA2 family phospholipase